MSISMYALHSADAIQLRLKHTIEHAHETTVKKVAFAPTPSHILSCSYDGSVKLWNSTSGEMEMLLFGAHPGFSRDLFGDYDGGFYAARAVAYSNSGDMVAVGRGSTFLFHISFGDSSWTRLQGTAPHEDAEIGVKALHFSRGDECIVTGWSDGYIHVFSTRDLSLVNSVHAHADQISSLSSSVLDVIVSGSYDSSLCLWDAKSLNRRRCVYRAHEWGVRDVLFTASGDNIVSCGHDAAIKIWSSKDLQCRLAVPDAHQDRIFELATSSSYLASASWDGAVKLWKMILHPQVSLDLVTTIGKRREMNWVDTCARGDVSAFRMSEPGRFMHLTGTLAPVWLGSLCDAIGNRILDLDFVTRACSQSPKPRYICQL